MLVFSPTPDSALVAQFSGPFVVECKVSDTDYMRVPACAPTRMCVCACACACVCVCVGGSFNIWFSMLVLFKNLKQI